MMHFAVIVHPSGRKRICLRIKYKKNLPRQALDRDEIAQQAHSLAFYAWGYRAWWCGRCRRLKFLCRKARPHPSGSRSAGAENTSVWRHFLLKPNVCQDRLGTNIGNTQKKKAFSPSRLDTMNDGTWEFTAKLMPPPPPPPGPKPKKPPPKPPPPPPFQPAYEIQFGVMEKGAEITATFSRSRFPLKREKRSHLPRQALEAHYDDNS
jgi:hypothetical protein